MDRDGFVRTSTLLSSNIVGFHCGKTSVKTDGWSEDSGKRKTKVQTETGNGVEVSGRRQGGSTGNGRLVRDQEWVTPGIVEREGRRGESVGPGWTTGVFKDEWVRDVAEKTRRGVREKTLGRDTRVGIGL